MTKPTFPEFWIVLHTRSEDLEGDRLQTRAACVVTQREAFEQLLEMACVTEAQRHEHRLRYAEVDILELCAKLKELSGDDFEAMLYEEFVSQRTEAELPAILRIENLIETPKPDYSSKFRKMKLDSHDSPYGRVVESNDHGHEPMNWISVLVRPGVKTLFKRETREYSAAEPTLNDDKPQE